MQVKVLAKAVCAYIRVLLEGNDTIDKALDDLRKLGNEVTYCYQPDEAKPKIWIIHYRQLETMV